MISFGNNLLFGLNGLFWFSRLVRFRKSRRNGVYLHAGVNLSELFFELQLRDETRIRRSLWEKAGDDTLRGLFLKKLRRKYDEAPDEAGRRAVEQAARWGLAALDRREEAVRHDDP